MDSTALPSEGIKRPIGVTISAIWLGVLCAAIGVLALTSGKGLQSIATAAGAFALLSLPFGLWRGSWNSYQFLRWLLVAAAVLGLCLAVLGSQKRPRYYYPARTVVMGAWAFYMFRPRVRDFFVQSRADGIHSEAGNELTIREAEHGAAGDREF